MHTHTHTYVRSFGYYFVDRAQSITLRMMQIAIRRALVHDNGKIHRGKLRRFLRYDSAKLSPEVVSADLSTPAKSFAGRIRFVNRTRAWKNCIPASSCIRRTRSTRARLTQRGEEKKLENFRARKSRRIADIFSDKKHLHIE